MSRFEGLWYDAPEDQVHGRWMRDPFKNVFIGCDPTDGMSKHTVEKFDAFVNVSCSECETLTPYPGKPQHYLWYPINEVGYWGMGPFFWTIKVLDPLLAQGKTIYHHCHAGAHRSPITFFVYLLYKGYSMVDASKIMWGTKENGKPGIDERMMLFRDILDGHISPFIFSFLEGMRRQPSYSLMGALHYARREFEWDSYYEKFNLPKPDPEVISNNTMPRFLREEESPFMSLRKQSDEYKAWCTEIMRPFFTEDDMSYWTEGEKDDEIIVFASQEHVTVDAPKEPT